MSLKKIFKLYQKNHGLALNLLSSYLCDSAIKYQHELENTFRYLYLSDRFIQFNVGYQCTYTDFICSLPNHILNEYINILVDSNKLIYIDIYSFNNIPNNENLYHFIYNISKCSNIILNLKSPYIDYNRLDFTGNTIVIDFETHEYDSITCDNVYLHGDIRSITINNVANSKIHIECCECLYISPNMYLGASIYGNVDVISFGDQYFNIDFDSLKTLLKFKSNINTNFIQLHSFYKFDSEQLSELNNISDSSLLIT